MGSYYPIHSQQALSTSPTKHLPLWLVLLRLPIKKHSSSWDLLCGAKRVQNKNISSPPTKNTAVLWFLVYSPQKVDTLQLLTFPHFSKKPIFFFLVLIISSFSFHVNSAKSHLKAFIFLIKLREFAGCQ